MRWGELIADSRPKDMGYWETPSATGLLYPVNTWSDFVQFQTETDTIVPTTAYNVRRKWKSLSKYRCYMLISIAVGLNVIQLKHQC